MAGVNECACLSAPIVNETLAQIQHRQIFRAEPGDFITDKSVILQGALYFFICQDRAYTQHQNLSGLDECGGAGSILPLTDNQCDFNLNHMNQRLPRAEIKYI